MVNHNFVGYVQLLLKDGLDPKMKNKHGYAQQTPISLAKRENRLLILSLFQVEISSDNTESKM